MINRIFLCCVLASIVNAWGLYVSMEVGGDSGDSDVSVGGDTGAANASKRSRTDTIPNCRKLFPCLLLTSNLGCTSYDVLFEGAGTDDVAFDVDDQVCSSFRS